VFGQNPVANFTATPLAGCSPLIVTFQDLSGGNPTGWLWDFGNGNTSTLQNPSATYFISGTYTVSLTVTNLNGTNTLTRAQYITVYEVPTVNFSADKQSGCFPVHVQFTDLSTAGPGNTNVSWLWDFGDGTTSTLQNPATSYINAGNFPVTLRVTNDKGCTKVISRSNYIIVTPGVRAGFNNTAPTVCAAPASITFTNTSTGPGTLTYQWNFGDGNNSTAQNPANIFATNGSFTVVQIVTSSSGCEDTVRGNIVIGGFTTAFTTATGVCANDTIRFANASTPVPVSSTWNFGDGNTGTGPDTLHVYTAPGTYTVWLYNTYSSCIDSINHSVTVFPLPVANFTAPVTTKCEPPLTVNFQDLSTGATSWQWNFGDGGTSTQQNPSHTYTSYGSYTVRLIVTSVNGCIDTLDLPAFVQIRRAIITIPSLPANGCIPFTINPIPVINSLDAVTSYLWDFGDGGTSTSPTPSHTYPLQGTYNVKLVITTSGGCADSVTIVGAVKVGSKPIADFSGGPSPVCAYQPVQFNDLSAPADQWQWDFGDGSTSTVQSPGHTYSDTGFFSIQLIAFNNGCPDTMIRTNYIQVLPPIAIFTFNADCINRKRFIFIDQSIGPITTWSWDFGDGNTSNAPSPTHIYASLGTYTVTLTVTNGTCSHSVVHTVSALDQSPDFVVSPNPVCKGSVVNFAPLNVNTALTASLLWDFGNGVQATTGAFSVNYIYIASGTYSPMMVTTDINGCKDTVIKTNYVRVNGPVANFDTTNGSGCVGLITTFNDLSATDGVNNITNWHWDFGDGAVQTFTTPPFRHTYNSLDTFTVKLIITDAFGCKDSITRLNLITTSQVTPGFLSTEPITCPNALVFFADTSISSGHTSFWDFGDGNTSVIPHPSHGYTDTGFYTVTLIIRDKYGCIDSVVKVNYIHAIEPHASFTVVDSLSSCIPFKVDFTNTSANYSTVFWDFGAGEGTSTVFSPVHYYSTPGVYRVKLVATGFGACMDSAFINITVIDAAGSTLTYAPLTGCNPLLVNLTCAPTGPIKSFFWDFGDGNTVTSISPDTSHTYISFGNYVPKVIMEDPSGCLITLTGVDTIHIRGANANFGFLPKALCDSGMVAFSDSTTFNEPILTYNWSFGDGGTSAQPNPTHYYAAPGSYDVTLTVQTLNCSNSITIPAAVKVVARPDIAIMGDNDICINDSILHAGVFLQPDTSIVKWSWVFPNANTAAVQNPPYQTYTTAGNFAVNAYAVNSTGCKDTAIQDIVVHPLPTVTMPSALTMQTGSSVIIPATYSAGVNTWLWNPVAGLSCADCANPSASPRFTTTYRVVFTDINGCRNAEKIQIVVICKDAQLFLPNTFSPNKDGSNDRFYPRGTGLYSVRVLRIFNRWGEIVFERSNFAVNDPLQGWDGTFKGKQPQPDVYIYQAEVVCDNGEIIKLSGNIALIL
jgi:gliding motility-associated-like protein